MELLIGCPVRKREWILNKWFDHVFSACAYAGLEPGFIFGADLQDTSTCEIIVDRTRGREAVVVPLQDQQREDDRDWRPHRLLHMVSIRNEILAHVRELRPRWFLSLDSDILLHEAAIFNLIQTYEENPWAAVGGKTYMTSGGVRWPSYGMETSTGVIRRKDSAGVHPVDVIMAIKLMGPEAYGVDYVFEKRGEDIGWSRACKASGLKLGWDGRVVSKHVMDPMLLDTHDPRAGF